MSDALNAPIVKLVLKYQPKTSLAQLAREVKELRGLPENYFKLLQYVHNHLEKGATYEEIQAAAGCEVRHG